MFGAAPAFAQLNNPIVVPIDCNATPNGIQAAIEAASIAQPVEVVLTGTCTEEVDVRRDHVTIRSSTPGTRATLIGKIDVRGADLVSLVDLHIRNSAGKASGIHAGFGASVQVRNCLLTGHRLRAMTMLRNAAVFADTSIFLGHPVGEETIAVVESAALRMERGRVEATNPAFPALGLFRGGIARVQFNTRLIHHAP